MRNHLSLSLRLSAFIIELVVLTYKLDSCCFIDNMDKHPTQYE